MTSPVFGDRVQETFITTGTGTISLAGPVVGYQAFAAVLSNTNTCYYSATDGVNWEVGLGTYASSGNTLARTTILESSNSGSAVNWSAGTKNIWLTFPAVAASNASGTITVGTTPTSGGTNGYILYDNGGVIGEKQTTGSGNVVLATSPTLVTPALGTPASGNLSNCTGIPGSLMTAFNVGCVIMARNATIGDPSTSPNATVSGGVLVNQYGNSGGFSDEGDSLSGTWKALQSTPSNGVGLWQRIA